MIASMRISLPFKVHTNAESYCNFLQAVNEERCCPLRRHTQCMVASILPFNAMHRLQLPLSFEAPYNVMWLFAFLFQQLVKNFFAYRGAEESMAVSLLRFTAIY